MKKLTEQTLLAQELGISVNSLKRIVRLSGLKYDRKEGKKYWDEEAVLKLIRAGRSSS